jgi:hypothetical protein
MTWSLAASVVVHLGVAAAFAKSLPALPDAPTSPASATTEMDLLEDQMDDDLSGPGASRATRAEVPGRPHALRSGPKHAARLQSRRDPRRANTARGVVTAPAEKPEASDDARGGDGGERAAPALDALAVARGDPEENAGLEDPLDRVLGLWAERQQLAAGAGAVDGLGSGTGGPGRGHGTDKSSPARLGGPVRWWSCPWPPGAGSLPIRHAVARLVVAVTSEGHARSAQVIDDPSGFGAGAKQCAMEHIYVSARDREGRAVPGTTLPFLVQFDR